MRVADVYGCTMNDDYLVVAWEHERTLLSQGQRDSLITFRTWLAS